MLNRPGLVGQFGRLTVSRPDGWAPFQDAGAGVVDTAVMRGVGAFTFTRNTTAYTRLASGLYALVASGSPRSMYAADGTYLGYWTENARADVLGTTAAIRRTMTDVGWAATNIAVGAATGIDGGAAAAASLTASAGNGTMFFACTLGAAVRTYSAWVRRKTGTGTINMTKDGGTSYTALTLTTTYTQFQVATASAANPSVGFQIVTSGDAIEVDFNTLEVATFANPTPIPLNVSKAADLMLIPTAGNLNNTSGSIYAEITVASPTGQNNIVGSYTGAAGGNPALIKSSDSKLGIYDDAGTSDVSAAITRPVTSVMRVATSWGATVAGSVNGTVISGIAYDGSLNLGANLAIGDDAANGASLFGSIKNVKFWLTEQNIHALAKS